MRDVGLGLMARRAAAGACAFIAEGDRDLAALTLADYMRRAEREGYCTLDVMHALCAALLHVIAAANIDAEVFRAQAADLMLLEGT